MPQDRSTPVAPFVTPQAEPQPRSWDPDTADIGPMDYLIGCLEKRWKGDDESIYGASVTCLAKTFHQAGFSTDEAIDAACDQMDRGTVRLVWNGNELEFQFDVESGDAGAHDATSGEVGQ